MPSYPLYVAIYRNYESAFQWYIAGTELEITMRPTNDDDVVYVDARTLCISNKTLVALRELSYHWRYLYEREVPPGHRDDDPTIEFTPVFLHLREEVSRLMRFVDKAVKDYLAASLTISNPSQTPAPMIMGKN
jgi:hypothetical protein